MDAGIQEKLKALLAQEGPGLLDDPSRLQERFDGLFTQHPQERRCLLAAWREHIPHELLDLRGRPLSELVLRELALRLARRQDLPEEEAMWSIGAWAAALGIVFTDAVSAASPGFSAGPGSGTTPEPAPVDLDRLQREAQDGDIDAQVRLGFIHRNGQGVPRDPREAVRWFSRAAKWGSPEAQCQLGIHLLEGSGVPKDYAKAREWFDCAARRNHPEAQFQLFKMSIEGKGTLPDGEPMQWLQRAAANGHSQAQCMLGVWYFDNPTGTRDRRRAFHLLQKAARQKIPLAHLYLGRILETGEGASRNIAQALLNYRLAQEGGEVEAGPAIELLFSGLRTSELVAFGLQAREEGNPDQAAFWWQRAVDRGDAAAQKYLADLLFTGQAGRRDSVLALSLYRKAAEGGSAEAQFALAELHEKGDEVVRDLGLAYANYSRAAKKGHPLASLRLDLLPEKARPADLVELAQRAEAAGDDAQAFFWYSQGARRKDPFCCLQLGLLWNKGRGTPRDAVKAREWLLKAGELGTVEAWHHLGLMATEGRNPDPTQAIAWFSRGAELGHMECQFRLGALFERGDGTTPDGPRAVHWYRRAAERGHARAQNSLGRLFLEGRLVPQDLGEAERLFRRAADQDLPRAHANLGTMYHRGLGLPRDFAQAARCLARAAELGDIESQVQLGRLYNDRQWEGANPREAEKWFLKAAGKGLTEALFALGELNFGRETFADAFEFFQRAANQGHVPSQYRLGCMFLEGRGIAANLEKAKSWLEQAAKSGHPKAQTRLGELHVDGRGVPRNLQEAARLFRTAAAANDPEGQLRLAEMLLEGKGILKDAPEAARLLQESADQGHPPAQMLLGLLYEEGTVLPKDLIQAYKWFNLASVTLPEAAERREALTQPGWMGFGRPRLLPPDELEAQRLSREWKPRQGPTGI